ncbi:MAG TPA: YicC family protein [Chitinophagales bacterium]|nr:YicC family protein [Chitinophagales bacterium]HMW12564.1 YicC family protein [Chitinophagales bacterium]HMX59828.1 YicC family protein [Chitinophagales bacterium]HMY22853.1 YicC family protein [Chitinophagales bacterium]HMZ33485.1 YicC family protein [Chitinophagales bacterium]
MLYSMTGYGKSTFKLGAKSYVIEIKSLNSKSLDLNFKVAAELRGKEIEIRKQIADQLIRGKVDIFFQEDKSTNGNTNLNFNLIESYYQQLQQFTTEKNIPLGDILPAILRFQDINKTELTELNDADVEALLMGMDNALKEVNKFRQKEGAQLERDLQERINIIQQHKIALLPFEQQRMEKLRSRLLQDLKTNLQENIIDKNRFEEELIYYMEKMDINEEKVRLDAHILYFFEILNEQNKEKGKKLGFVAQEIGREINTIGSKSNDANMQKIVVQMKDELEKIKEQVLNIL